MTSTTPLKSSNDATTTTPYLEFASVRFQQDGDASAFRVSLTKPLFKLVSIWIECKRTKAQWTCEVSCFRDHAPTDADYLLPAAVVLEALETALGCASDASNPQRPQPSIDSSVSFSMDDRSTGNLVLQIKLCASFCAEFAFNMTPLARDATAVLSAKLRDVEDELAQHRLAFAALSAECSTPTTNGHAIAWATKSPRQSTTFEVADDGCSVTVHQTGLYVVDVEGTPSFENCGLRLMVDGKWRADSETDDANGVYLNSTLILVRGASVVVKAFDMDHYEGCKARAVFVSSASMHLVLLRSLPI
ncbi:Aste57867_10282 [Aphanomyces stellatus]|uniref:Aste57867_10282 protein n=1 Tax=Aphanomyces stellatus TaxID=120398 RepID=A0A485KQ13_9STRA|nr:hypothetical protein As57867_010242 [Aphanomyces stellatus]VFT87156.1 Aste57867_10282 [Aphanomyces stellatus]